MKNHSPALRTAAAELVAHVEPAHPRATPTAAVTAAAYQLASLLHIARYSGKATLSLLEEASQASPRNLETEAATAAGLQLVMVALRKQEVYGKFIKR